MRKFHGAALRVDVADENLLIDLHQWLRDHDLKPTITMLDEAAAEEPIDDPEYWVTLGIFSRDLQLFRFDILTQRPLDSAGNFVQPNPDGTLTLCVIKDDSRSLIVGGPFPDPMTAAMSYGMLCPLTGFALQHVDYGVNPEETCAEPIISSKLIGFSPCLQAYYQQMRNGEDVE